jgi:hypothetical protein
LDDQPDYLQILARNGMLVVHRFYEDDVDPDLIPGDVNRARGPEGGRSSRQSGSFMHLPANTGAMRLRFSG